MRKRTRRATRRPVSSLAEYLDQVEQVIQSWAPDRDFYPWFRGHADGSWSLTPSLYRRSTPELDEDEFRDDFRRRAWPYLAGTAREPESEWEWYFLMQHHGLPTRLIDWTESALFALYFAVREPVKDANASVWILDPWTLNRRVARKGDVILTPHQTGVRRYLPATDSSAALPLPPIAIEPPLKSNRISAQRGVFTIHGATKRSLGEYAILKPRLTKVEIVHSKSLLLREQLLVAGITETTVFPELTALCRELLQFWSFDSDSLKPSPTRLPPRERARPKKR